MSHGESRVRPQMNYGFFTADPSCERWRNWARGHNRSAEYDGSSTTIRRSWFGRVPASLRAGGPR